MVSYSNIFLLNLLVPSFLPYQYTLIYMFFLLICCMMLFLIFWTWFFRDRVVDIVFFCLIFYMSLKYFEYLLHVFGIFRIFISDIYYGYLFLTYQLVTIVYMGVCRTFLDLLGRYFKSDVDSVGYYFQLELWCGLGWTKFCLTQFRFWPNLIICFNRILFWFQSGYLASSGRNPWWFGFFDSMNLVYNLASNQLPLFVGVCSSLFLTLIGYRRKIFGMISFICD